MIKKLFTAFLLLLLIAAIAFTSFRVLFPIKYKNTVEKYCAKYTVDRALVYALIKAESNFNEKARSHAGAKGLMQITDMTFEYCRNELGISSDDIFDPETNIRVGIWYLSYLLDKYHGNIKNAVAAYNAGETNVDIWLSNPKHSGDGKVLTKIPFGETDRHVSKIRKYIRIYDFIYF